MGVVSIECCHGALAGGREYVRKGVHGREQVAGTITKLVAGRRR